MVMTALPFPLITAVSDRRRLSGRGEEACDLLVEWAAAVARAGVDVIQVREHGLTDRALADVVRRVVGATAATAAVVLVNDRADVALVTGCAGVHLPATGPPARAVRRATVGDFRIGRSVHPGDDLPARADGCDYVTFGTVFPSASKPAGHHPAGLDAFERACRAAPVPVQAIGGITLGNVAAVARAGAGGIAAIGLFSDGWRSPGSADRLAARVGAVRAAFAEEGGTNSG
jgi:thiamine-phosphate diphosphorylase